MALEKVKTEMTGTGGGRWAPRAVVKTASATRRRRNGAAEIAEGLADVGNDADLAPFWKEAT